MPDSQAGQRAGLGAPVHQRVAEIEPVIETEVQRVAGTRDGDRPDRWLRSTARRRDPRPVPVAAAGRRRRIGNRRRTGGDAGGRRLRLGLSVLDRLVIRRLIRRVVGRLQLGVDVALEGVRLHFGIGLRIRVPARRVGKRGIGGRGRQAHAVRVERVDDREIGAILGQAGHVQPERAAIGHRVTGREPDGSDVKIQFVALGPERVRRERAAAGPHELRIEIQGCLDAGALRRQRHPRRLGRVDRCHVGGTVGQAADAFAGHRRVDEALPVVGAHDALELQVVAGLVDLGHEQRGRTALEHRDILLRRDPVRAGVDAQRDKRRRCRHRVSQGVRELDRAGGLDDDVVGAAQIVKPIDGLARHRRVAHQVAGGQSVLGAEVDGVGGRVHRNDLAAHLAGIERRIIAEADVQAVLAIGLARREANRVGVHLDHGVGAIVLQPGQRRTGTGRICHGVAIRQIVVQEIPVCIDERHRVGGEIDPGERIEHQGHRLGRGGLGRIGLGRDPAVHRSLDVGHRHAERQCDPRRSAVVGRGLDVGLVGVARFGCDLDVAGREDLGVLGGDGVGGAVGDIDGARERRRRLVGGGTL